MKKRSLALLVALIMCISISTCGMAAISTEGLPISDEPIVLTAAGSKTSFQTDLNSTVVFVNFAKESNVTIDFQNIPDSDVGTQRNLMLASGEVPDILFKMSVSATDQAKYADQGMFVPLSDYEEYMPNLMSWFEKFPTQKDAVTQADGKIYAAPYILAGDAIRMSNKLWFNTQVLDALNMEVPTTTEEFYDYLVACKGLDFNGNGQADEIPLSANGIGYIVSALAGSFGLYNRGSSHTNVYVDEDGVMQYAWNSERYRSLLSYLHRLYSEKLLDQNIFSLEDGQVIASCSAGTTLTYAYVNNSMVSNSPYEDSSLGYREPLEGPDGFKIYGNYSLPASTDGQFLITYKCAEKGEDYVKAAVRWMDHWYSEEGIISYFMGVEGVTYEKDENSPGGLKLTEYVLHNPSGAPFGEILAEYCSWSGGANPSVATDEYFKGGETWPVCLEAVKGLVNYLPETIWAPFTRYYSVSDAEEFSSIGTDLTTYVNEWRAYFITGERSLEDDWDEYVAGFDGMKLPRYMEIYESGRQAAGAV